MCVLTGISTEDICGKEMMNHGIKRVKKYDDDIYIYMGW